MSINLGSTAVTSILIDDESASEHEIEGEIFHTALEDAIVPKQEELEIELEIDETYLNIDNPFIGDGINRQIFMIDQPADDHHVEPETDGWKEDDFKRDVVCGTPAISAEEGERRFVYWNPPSIIEEEEDSPFLFFPSASERPESPPATPPTASTLPESDDVIVLSGPESDDDAMVGEVKPSIPLEAEKPALKKRKRAAPRAPKVQPPIFRYPAGKMTADEFIAASSVFHLVIEQEGTPGRIGRVLLEHDLKPREFSTGSYGWSGSCQGGLPTTKGQVQVRCMVNLIAKGSKPIQINKPAIPVKRT